MNSVSPQTKHSITVFLRSERRESAHQIFFFVAAVCTPFCHPPHTHCRQTISTIFYSLYSASVPWHCLQQYALYLYRTLASRRVQLLVLIREFCSCSAPMAPRTVRPTTTEPKRIRKGLQSSWVMGHVTRSLFILGFSFGDSGGFDSLFDRGRGARLICRGSFAGGQRRSRSYAGVTEG